MELLLLACILSSFESIWGLVFIVILTPLLWKRGWLLRALLLVACASIIMVAFTPQIDGSMTDAYYAARELLTIWDDEPQLTLKTFSGNKRAYAHHLYLEKIRKAKTDIYIAVSGLYKQGIGVPVIKVTSARSEQDARNNLSNVIWSDTIVYRAKYGAPQALKDLHFPDFLIRCKAGEVQLSDFEKRIGHVADAALEISPFPPDLIENEIRSAQDQAFTSEIKSWLQSHRDGMLTGRVTEVLSGDTIKVEGHAYPIHLKGVRVPSGGFPAYSGTAERETLERMVLDKTVFVNLLRADEEVPSCKRQTPARVYFANGVSVNKEVVSKGGAQSTDSYTKDPNIKYPVTYLDMETGKLTHEMESGRAPRRKDSDREHYKAGLVKIKFMDTANQRVIKYKFDLTNIKTGEKTQRYVYATNSAMALTGMKFMEDAAFKRHAHPERRAGEPPTKFIITDYRPTYDFPPVYDQPPVPDKAVLDAMERKATRERHIAEATRVYERHIAEATRVYERHIAEATRVLQSLTARMKRPKLYEGQVGPGDGYASEDIFTYSVYYYTEDGDPAVVSRVYIDGGAEEMSLERGDSSRGLYSFSTGLGPGEHEFYFEFSDLNDGEVRDPEFGSHEGPSVLKAPSRN